MKRILIVFVVVTTIFIVSCGNKPSIPNVDNIAVSLTVQRFDKDFFAIDTNNIEAGLDKVSAKYPMFILDYLHNIQGIPPNKDSTIKYTKLFLTDKLYKLLYDSIKLTNFKLDEVTKDLTFSFKLIKYYFPNYKLPQNLITYVAPIEGIGCALTYSGLAVGLQSYMGSGFSAYHNEYITQTYPSYKTARFAQPYIVVDCIKNIINDMYPPRNLDKNLIEQMIDGGKRWYCLQQFLPKTNDTLLSGYTQKQLTACNKNEAAIWSYFIEQNLIYEKEPNTITPYINDAPNTPEISAEAPGNIGQFVGYQVVKKWLSKYPKTTLQQLMETNEKQIFDEAKYKP